MAILNNMQGRNTILTTGDYVKGSEGFPLALPEGVEASDEPISLDVGEGECVKFYGDGDKSGWQSMAFYAGFYENLRLYPDFPKNIDNIEVVEVSEVDYDFYDLLKVNYNVPFEAKHPEGTEQAGEEYTVDAEIFQMIPPGRYTPQYDNQIDSIQVPNRMRVKLYDKGYRGQYESAGKMVKYFGHGKTQVFWGGNTVGYELIDLQEIGFANQVSGIDVRSGDEVTRVRIQEIAGTDMVEHKVEFDYTEWLRLERRPKSVGDLLVYMRHGKIVHATGTWDLRKLMNRGTIEKGSGSPDTFAPCIRVQFKDKLNRPDLYIADYDEFTWENPPPLRHIYKIYDKFVWEKDDVIVASVMAVDVKQITVVEGPPEQETAQSEPEA